MIACKKLYIKKNNLIQQLELPALDVRSVQSLPAAIALFPTIQDVTTITVITITNIIIKY